MNPKAKGTQLHFVGIGGIGMSGIAEVFLNQGYSVSGSDLSESDSTRHLTQAGARVSIGHRAENVRGAQVVIISSAVRPANPEVVEAKRLRIPIIPRAEMLGELMRGRTGIAVAGTHGKTTTTSMLATVLTVAGIDPTLVIGGKVDSLGGNAKLGQGKYVVAEADESDGSFLHLPATLGIVTNIDNDHLDHFKSLEAIEQAFVDFVGKLPFYGVAAVCGDDAGVRRILNRVTKPIVTYGMSEEWDYSARAVKAEGLGSSFEVYDRRAGKLAGRFKLNVPGEHNVLNALAAIAIARHIDLEYAVIARGLEEFRGVKRRFEIRWQDTARKQVIVDDYGHHPTEIAATLAAARAYWPGRIVTVFQPHRYSRTLHCRDGFLAAFRHSDVVLITDIYAAGEDPIDGVDAASLAAAIRRASPTQEVSHVGDLLAAQAAVLKVMKPGDLVLCCGAGSITKLPDQLMASVTGAREGVSAVDSARWFKEQAAGFTGELLFEEPLSKHTYYRIGGPARVFTVPKSLADLHWLAQGIGATGIAVFVLGAGSNLLVSDEGFAGLVIRASRVDLGIEAVGPLAKLGEVQRVRTGASVAVSTLLRRAAQEGWGGLELLTGIPGSVGGVVTMNAGTHLGEAKDRLRRIEVFELLNPGIRSFEAADFKYEYRKNLFLPAHSVAVSAEWDVRIEGPAQVKARIDETLARRKATQPIDYPSCGSVFKNPRSHGLSAWEVVDRLGLRGHRVGGAQFAEKHSNFIINLGGATAADVRALIRLAKERAAQELGVVLEEEVMVL